MFVLRKPHMDAFAEVARESFEDRMVEQLQIRFAPQCRELGEAGVRARVGEGVKRAGRYDLAAEQDVAGFIRYMFGIRPDFDTARQTSWAGTILKDKSLAPHERIEKIRLAALEHRAEARNSGKATSD